MRRDELEILARTPLQEQVISFPVSGSLLISGQPGTGKTTAAAARLRAMTEAGVPAETILILVPQRNLAEPYMEVIRDPGYPAGGTPTVVTMGGLAQRTLSLFWPAVAANAGFKHPDLPPTFLTLETAQYYMAKVVQPLLARGYFEQLVIDRNRLFTQLLDNLNKAAVVGFDYREIGTRLADAWIGKDEQLLHYQQSQDCINSFREFCLENNLLDYSLQFEVFCKHLWPSHLVRQYLTAMFQHLIYENIEEDVPAAHEIIKEWLPSFESAVLILDDGAGYRAFLGADPDSAQRLAFACDQEISFEGSLVTSSALREFSSTLSNLIGFRDISEINPGIRQAFRIFNFRFFPEMVDSVAAQVSTLIHEEGVLPGQIAIVSPFLSDTLRHALSHRLQGYSVQARTLRPSRSLRDEPASRCLFTLARLAHPQWNLAVDPFEVRSMLLQAIEGLDLVRAELITFYLFSKKNKAAPLNNFDPLKPDLQERITYSIGERFMRLRDWLGAYLEQDPVELDTFFARLFGEILSQPGFGFHEDYSAAGVTARLIESVQKFRRVAEPGLITAGSNVGQEYIQMVSDGVIAAQYLQPYVESAQNAVLIAPAYSFLVNNAPVKYQFWLDVGSLGWWERLYQPLTHPHVLSNRWERNRKWTDIDEVAANQDTLQRLVKGMIARCGEHIILCTTSINERGSEEKGPLLQAVQSILRRTRDGDGSHV